MTNIETLESAMDNFIVNYGSLQYGGLPFVDNIMYNIVTVTPAIPSDMTFTPKDISDVANYFNTKYPGYFTYDEWYNTMLDYLQPYIATPSQLAPPAPDVTVPPASAVTPSPAPPTDTGAGKSLLIIGGIVVLIAVLGWNQ
jgi:hypothetical protein